MNEPGGFGMWRYFYWFHFFLLFTLFCAFYNWNVIISTFVHDNNWRLAIVNWRLLCSFLNIFVNELQYSVFINKIKNDRIRDKKRFIKNRSSRMWWHIHIEIDLFISLCLYNIAISRIDIDNEYGMKILLAFLIKYFAWVDCCCVSFYWTMVNNWYDIFGEAADICYIISRLLNYIHI